MKLLFSLILLFLSCYGFSQRKAVSSFALNSNLDVINIYSPDTLAYLLTAPYAKEIDKVKSIFFWITENISYNTIRYQLRYKQQTDDVEADYDADSVYKSLDERVARITLKRKYALCDGYARLFKSLCDFAGIKSEVITGYARTNMGSNQFACNHKWNAVMIDSNWYLLDATWASGYLNFSGTSFIRDYNANYFLSPPKYFVQDHYPDDIRWTLLDNPPALSEFNRSPFKLPAFNYKIISYQPAKGVIHATVGDTVTVALETLDDKKNLFLSDMASIDSAHLAFTDSCLKAGKSFTVKDDKISGRYLVTSEDAKWLQVIYNGAVVLRYKLNIRKAPLNLPVIIVKDIALNN